MYDLVLTYVGEAAIIETGMTLDFCKAVVDYLYSTGIPKDEVWLTCEVFV